MWNFPKFLGCVWQIVPKAKHSFDELSTHLSSQIVKGNLQRGGGRRQKVTSYPSLPKTILVLALKVPPGKKSLCPKKNIASYFRLLVPKCLFLVIGWGGGGKGKCPATCWTTQIPRSLARGSAAWWEECFVFCMEAGCSAVYKCVHWWMGPCRAVGQPVR